MLRHRHRTALWFRRGVALRLRRGTVFRLGHGEAFRFRLGAVLKLRRGAVLRLRRGTALRLGHRGIFWFRLGAALGLRCESVLLLRRRVVLRFRRGAVSRPGCGIGLKCFRQEECLPGLIVSFRRRKDIHLRLGLDLSGEILRPAFGQGGTRHRQCDDHHCRYQQAKNLV